MTNLANLINGGLTGESCELLEIFGYQDPERLFRPNSNRPLIIVPPQRQRTVLLRSPAPQIIFY